MKQYIHEIFYLLGSDRQKIPAILILFIVSSLLDLVGLGLIGPYIMLLVEQDANTRGIIGDVIDLLNLPREPKSLLKLIGVVMIAVFVLKAISAIVINRVILGFSQQRQVWLTSRLMHAYQSLSYTDYLRRNSSEYIYSIQTLTSQYTGSVVAMGLKMTSDGIMSLVIFIMLAWTNLLALILLASILVISVLSYDKFFRKRIYTYGKRINELNTQLVQGIHEGIEGMKEIRILGKESYFHDVVRESIKKSSLLYIRSQLISIAPRYMLEILMVSFIVALVFITQYMELDMKGLIPTLGVFGLASLRLLPVASGMTNGIIHLRYSRDGVSRLYKDLIELNKNDNKDTLAKPKNLVDTFRTLSLEQVSFRYPKMSQLALNEVSMKIIEGESIGFIGPSGSGKTTLVDVLLGLLEPQHGAIFFNGQTLNDSLANWRTQIAYLPQDVFLTDNTLRCNVALGVPESKIDNARLIEALRQARLAELVEQLPDGIDTFLGERGIRLSGGQKQRVALARAFYHERNILVLDEATSSLDSETEKEIVSEINHLKGTKTMIVIAHRLSTVQNCDRIYRLENGRISSFGTPAEMLDKFKVS